MCDKPGYKYIRDITPMLQMLREFLLGRKYTLHNRNPNYYAPRSIPPADVPRGPYKYSADQYYTRSAYDSVHPAVIAPIAAGPALPGTEPISPDCVEFSKTPKPGECYWWDGHCYYEEDGNLPMCGPEPPLTCDNVAPSCEKK